MKFGDIFNVRINYVLKMCVVISNVQSSSTLFVIPLKSAFDTKLSKNVFKINDKEYLIDIKDLVLIKRTQIIDNYYEPFVASLTEVQLEQLQDLLISEFDLSSRIEKLNNDKVSVVSRLINSKNYNKVRELSTEKTTSLDNLNLEAREDIFNNYSRETRDALAEKYFIYPYERCTKIAYYLRTKMKKYGKLI